MDEHLDDRRYSARHLWAEPLGDGSTAYVGITDYLADELGPIDSLDLPTPGDDLDADALAFHFHINNRIHHVRAILNGKVLEINRDVQENPNLLHLDPERNWLMKVEYDDPDDLDMLMDAAQYASYLDGL